MGCAILGRNQEEKINRDAKKIAGQAVGLPCEKNKYNRGFTPTAYVEQHPQDPAAPIQEAQRKPAPVQESFQGRG